MVGPRVRTAFLALAMWAVLFAPGAAVDDLAGRAPTVDADRVAAAVIAPTFGSDGVVVAKSCRADDVDRPDCEIPPATASRASALHASDGVESIAASEADHRSDETAGALTSTRGPPAN